jgi:hypothetical protein
MHRIPASPDATKIAGSAGAVEITKDPAWIGGMGFGQIAQALRTEHSEDWTRVDAGCGQKRRALPD